MNTELLDNVGFDAQAAQLYACFNHSADKQYWWFEFISQKVTLKDDTSTRPDWNNKVLEG